MSRRQLFFGLAVMLVLWVLGGHTAPIFAAPILVGNVTGLQERAALIQRDMADAVMEFRPSQARTLATFEQGTRSKKARMAGLQIPYWKDRAHGQTLYNPVTGSNSFKKSTKQNSGAMYVGVVYRNMNIWLESHVLQDMNNGFIPDSYIKERRRRISTHMWKKNKAAIGDGTGSIATVVSGAGSTITVLADNSARGTSKGGYFVQKSDSTDPLYYDCVNPANDTVVATFYVTAKPTATTLTVAGFTVGNIAATNNAGYKICESGFWKLEMQGLASHISDSTSRIYQGADVSVDEFLQNPAVDAGNVAVTPSAVHSAKGIMMTRANQEEGKLSFIGHITWGNYRTLAKFGYTLRQYVADGSKNNTKTTYGLPTVYEDGDTMWVPDADYEDAYIDLRERAAFFEYVLKEFGPKTVDGITRHEYIGTNSVGSTNEYENYNEACNIVWDSRGVDGSREDGGSPNSSVFIKNIALPTERQSTYGV